MLRLVCRVDSDWLLDFGVWIDGKVFGFFIVELLFDFSNGKSILIRKVSL